MAGLGLTLPIAPAPTNIMYLLILIGWALSGDWAEKWRVLKQSSVAQAVAFLCALILLGTLYGEASASENFHYVTKYSSLILVPVLISLQLNAQEKWRALSGFCIAMLITLLLSFLIWLNWLPAGLIKEMDPSNPVVFKLHITHGFFMAIAAFFLCFCARGFSDWRRMALLILALLAVINVLLMVKGRTGQAVVMALLVYLFYLRFSYKGLLAGIAATLVLAIGAYAISPAFKERSDIAVHEATHWQARQGENKVSSIGQRFDYYLTSFSIIKKHPLFGVGTGGFPRAYVHEIEGTDMEPSNNPHNQYLLITAQLGLIGLLALLGVYAACWRSAAMLQAPFSQLLIGVVLAYVVGNLFNSFMLDFSERLLFVWAIGILLSHKAAEQTPQ
jgi:hypothetical protein